MYTFAALLARAPSGLYRLVGDGHAVEIGRLCRIKGVSLFRVHGREVRNKKRFLTAVAHSMRFPKWFGMNWDALADCLTDFEWQQATAHLLLVSEMEGFARQAPPDFATALAVLDEAASFWAERGVRFLVVVASRNIPQWAPLPVVRAP